MPSYLVKQPDGKYAMFSTIVDDFTWFGMNEDEAVAACVEDGCTLTRAARKLENADTDEFSSYHDWNAPLGQRRWLGCIRGIQMVHGEARAQRRALLDFSEDEDHSP